jgi:inorganic pyrophosphatase
VFVLTVRLLGVIEAEQTEDDRTVRNDRLIAVAVHAHTHEHEHHLKDLRPGLIDEIVQFFVQYNRLRGKEFKPLGNRGPKAAIKLVEDAVARFQKR